MTPARARVTIENMMMSPHTHIALTSLREQELRHSASRAHIAAEARLHASETPAPVRRLRHRLARMHLAPAAHA